MKLYHGTNIEISEIDLGKCHPFKDFGQGFYLTPVYDDALTLARNRAVRLGGKAIVNEFDYDHEAALKDPTLKIKTFEQPDQEWVKFVMQNRNEKNSLPEHDFDIIIGPIADDRVAASISLYQDDFISIESLIERLKFRRLTIQYFFHTSQAIKYLKKS